MVYFVIYTNFRWRIKTTEETTLYNLLDDGLLQRWREAVEKAESETWFFTNEQETLEKLGAELNEKSKKLLTSYSSALENRIDYVYFKLQIKVLNFGIKIGIELQKAFAEFAE